MRLLQRWLPSSRLLPILATLTAALLCSCGSVPIHDIALYIDLGPAGATEIHYLTPGQTDIPPTSWDADRIGMYCMSGDDWGFIKAELEKLCSAYHFCTYPTAQKQLMAFFARAEAVRKRRLP